VRSTRCNPDVLWRITRKSNHGIYGPWRGFFISQRKRKMFQHAYITGSTMKDKSIYQNAQNRKLEKNTHDLNIGVGYGNSAFCSFPFACCLLSPVEMRTGAVHLRFIRFFTARGDETSTSQRSVYVYRAPQWCFSTCRTNRNLFKVRYGGTQLTSEY